MTSKVTYIGDLRTEATHLASNNTIITDAPVDNNGKGEAFSPTDLVATALAQCMMTIIGIKAKSYDKDPVGMYAEVTKVMAANPRRISEVLIKLVIPNNNYDDHQKAMLMEAGYTCPVAKSLHQDIVQNVEIVFE